MTNDLEHLDISSGGMNYNVGKEIVDYSLPSLLDLYSKYDIKSTFFVLGSFANKFPEAIDLISQYGHEIACHGFSHEVSHGFDVMSLEDQQRHLSSSKLLLEKLSNQEVVSFRSPALRINSDTIQALQDTGFLIDSSVCPRRLDSFLSYGTSNKLGWLGSPKEPYYASKSNPFEKGNSKILEIPISSLFFGFTGTTMRSSPFIFRILSKKVMVESMKNNSPVVFLFHPNELIPHRQKTIYRRSKNFFGFLLKDYLRKHIKSRNLGKNCFYILEEMIKNFKKKGFEFLTVRSYYEKIKGNSF